MTSYRSRIILLGARNVEGGRAAVAELANEGDVRFVELDVTDDASVQAATRSVRGAVFEDDGQVRW
jgi:NAD(P)-dependent dehydrogenase (short-subunit alcohol dehydrogenase family)